LGKDKRISMIRKRTSLILNKDLIGFFGWPGHEVKRQTAEVKRQTIERTNQVG
jgi:hypothetical protein